MFNQLETKDGLKAVIKTNRGDMEFVLFPEIAPKAVENFTTDVYKRQQQLNL